jgi:hypothetical protein
MRRFVPDPTDICDASSSFGLFAAQAPSRTKPFGTVDPDPPHFFMALQVLLEILEIEGKKWKMGRKNMMLQMFGYDKGFGTYLTL